MKKLSKYIPYLILISFLLYVIIGLYNRNKYDDEISKTGKYCIAIVTNKSVTKGNTSSINYEYLFRGKEYRFERYVSKYFYK